jgi:riboflavin kinase/FMN adenylyltransferase
MKSLNGYSGLSEDQKGAVIALGNFDGVHAGHRVVLDQARVLAEQLSAPLGVALFQPHPRRFFAPDAQTFRLMGIDRRNATLSELGVDQLHILPFDAEMARMTPEIFVERVLHSGLGVRGVVTGADFRFGNGRAGSGTDLERLGAASGIATAFAELEANGADKISSTRIRKAIQDGDMQAAAELLGRRWVVDGRVRRGNQRGRTIGFPTANIAMGDFVRPAYGVYAVRAGFAGEAPDRPAVANIGKRPTVGGEIELLEVHVFDFDKDVYEQPASVEFHEFIRPERRFDDFDALKAQIAIDADTARAMLVSATGPA